jgi:hypothetical protein
MRSYLSVTGGVSLFQQREHNLRFEARATLINSGNVPAKNVRVFVNVGILDYPYAEDVVLPLPMARVGSAFIPPQQNRTITAPLDHFVDDEEVAPIIARDGKGLYVWGRVLYDDDFGENRECNFAHSVYWFSARDGGLMPDVEYLPGMNDGT